MFSICLEKWMGIIPIHFSNHIEILNTTQNQNRVINNVYAIITFSALIIPANHTTKYNF